MATGSMFDIPEEDKQALTQQIDEMIADMDTRSEQFLQDLDKQRDDLNANAETLTPEELERRDLLNGISQMSADYALVPHRFIKNNRDALLRNGPDLIYMIVDMVMFSQRGIHKAVDKYQRNVQAILDGKDIDEDTDETDEGDNS